MLVWRLVDTQLAQLLSTLWSTYLVLAMQRYHTSYQDDQLGRGVLYMRVGSLFITGHVSFAWLCLG